ncbi:MAG: hypothetical protein KatS3mg105_5287 [Gemmatales bacterium]|nr:MAG: hypothetical protein KatS3mg105_5287 [Gemmatales bacterium]
MAKETRLSQTPPFPWYGGKRKCADYVWRRLGKVNYYVEPFAGGMAVGLACPHWNELTGETYNDADGLLVNCWRSISTFPSVVWANINRPRAEIELRSWARWLRETVDRQRLVERMQVDPTYCDPHLAGIWLWGICASACGWFVQLHRGPSVPADLPTGILSSSRIDDGHDWLLALASRLSRAIILCGDWKRVVTPSRLGKAGTVGIFLDPPYAGTEAVYNERYRVTTDVLAWCKNNGANPRYRIAVCGFDEYSDLEALGWQAVQWRPGGGFRNRATKQRRRIDETVWFSPHCVVSSE